MHRLILPLALLLFLALPARADEPCPGCGGGGAVGCPACASPFGLTWLGKCNGCQGYSAWSRPAGRCNKCGDTGVCQQCGGRGQACMVCRGSGRVPDGTGAAAAERRAKERKAKIGGAMKPLEFMAGRWRGKGTTGDKELTSEYSWEKVVDDSYLALVERETVEGETTETAAVLTYGVSQEGYLLYVFGAREGGLHFLTGPGDGRNVTFKTGSSDGREFRMKWILDPDGGRGKTISEVGGGDDWETVGKSTSERTGDSTLQLKRADPAGKMKALAGLVGKWDTTSEANGKTTRSTITWRSVLGGHWFSLYEKGDDGQALAMLGWLPAEENYIFVIFGAGGEVSVYNGKSKRDGQVVFAPSGNDSVRWTWTAGDEEMKAVVEVKGEDGWKKTATISGSRK